MKNLFWVGVPFSMLSLLVQAQVKNEAVAEKEVPHLGQALEIPSNVELLEDGGVRFLSEDGTSITISKKTIDFLYKMKLSKEPKFDKSTPCVAAVNNK